MRKVFLLSSVCVITPVVLFFIFFQSTKMTDRIMVGEYSVSVEIARTPEEQGRGLMYRTELSEDAGMLFLFTQPSYKTFWNKNTLIALDVLWIRDGIVIGISELPAISNGLTTIASPSEVDRVLEVNGGWSARHNVHIGTRVW